MAINFKVSLPTAATGVVTRELTVQVGKLPAVVKTNPVNMPEVDGFAGEINAPVKLSLVDIDAAGKRAAAAKTDVVLLDALAPVKAGQWGLVEISRR